MIERLFIQEGAQALPGEPLVGETVERVLSVPPFAARELSWIQKFIGSIQEAIAELKYWALERLGNWLGESEATGTIIIVILVAIAAALLLSFVWSFVRPGASEKRLRQGSKTQADLYGVPLLDARLAKTRDLAAAGRFAEAMSALYQATCLWLDDGGHARYEDDKTGGDYAREIDSGELRSSFRKLLVRFYPVAYGGREASMESYDGMRGTATELGVPE